MTAQQQSSSRYLNTILELPNIPSTFSQQGLSYENRARDGDCTLAPLRMNMVNACGFGVFSNMSPVRGPRSIDVVSDRDQNITMNEITQSDSENAHDTAQYSHNTGVQHQNLPPPIDQDYSMTSNHRAPCSSFQECSEKHGSITPTLPCRKSYSLSDSNQSPRVAQQQPWTTQPSSFVDISNLTDRENTTPIQHGVAGIETPPLSHSRPFQSFETPIWRSRPPPFFNQPNSHGTSPPSQWPNHNPQNPTARLSISSNSSCRTSTSVLTQTPFFDLIHEICTEAARRRCAEDTERRLILFLTSIRPQRSRTRHHRRRNSSILSNSNHRGRITPSSNPYPPHHHHRLPSTTLMTYISQIANTTWSLARNTPRAHAPHRAESLAASEMNSLYTSAREVTAAIEGAGEGKLFSEVEQREVAREAAGLCAMLGYREGAERCAELGVEGWGEWVVG